MKQVNNNWVCNSDNSVYTPSDGVHGFVYEVMEKKTGRWYIGKKQVTVKTDFRKKGAVQKYSNWQKYRTSQKELSESINAVSETRNDHYEFRVLWECYDETVLKYCEAREILAHHALVSDSYFNDNVSIKHIGKIKNFAQRATIL